MSDLFLSLDMSNSGMLSILSVTMVTTQSPLFPARAKHIKRQIVPYHTISSIEEWALISHNTGRIPRCFVMYLPSPAKLICTCFMAITLSATYLPHECINKEDALINNGLEGLFLFALLCLSMECPLPPERSNSCVLHVARVTPRAACRDSWGWRIHLPSGNLTITGAGSSSEVGRGFGKVSSQRARRNAEPARGWFLIYRCIKDHDGEDERRSYLSYITDISAKRWRRTNVITKCLCHNVTQWHSGDSK